MSISIHPPESVAFSGELTEDIRRELERALIDAVGRAIASVDVDRGLSNARTFRAERAVSVGEAMDPARFDADSGTYAVRSFDEKGALVRVAAKSFPDRIVAGASPVDGDLILVLPGFVFVHLGGAERYIEASNFARAVQLGLGAFGRTSFAVLEGPIGEEDSHFWAVATDIVVSDELLGKGSDPFAVGGQQAVGYSASHQLLQIVQDDEKLQYFVHTVYTLEREALVRDRPSASRLAETLRHPGPRFSRQERRTRIFEEIDPLVRAILDGDDTRLEEAAGRLAELDLEAYILVDWRTKVGYLEVLVKAWTMARHEKAIVEIMRSLGDASELRAAQAMLASRGLFDQLFNDLDSELWSLLSTVGHKFGDPGPLTLESYISLLGEAIRVPRSLDEAIERAIAEGNPIQLGLDVLAEVHEAALALVRFLVGILEALELLVTHPLKILEGLGHLAKLVVAVEMAKYGDPKSVREVAALVNSIGTKLIDGFKGTAVLQVGPEVVRRIKWALIVEVASWFIGVGEIKAAVASVGLTEKVAAALRFLGIIGKLSDAAEAEIIAARLARVARAMRGSSKVLRELKGEEDVMRLLAELPEDDVVRLGNALERVDVSEAATLATLTAHPELGAVVEESARKIEVLQTLAKKAGGLTEELAAAFRHLAGRRGFHTEELARIAEALRHGEGARFVAVLERIGLERIGARAEIRADFLELLAGDAKRMNAVGDFGYEVLRTTYRRAGRDAEAFDAALVNLRSLQSELGRQGKADEFRRLLDRLAAGDPAAWAEVGGTAHAVALGHLAEIAAKSPKAQAGLNALVRGGHDDIAAFLARESLSDADRLRTIATLERLSELSATQVDGFAAVMRLPKGSLGGIEREAILTFDRGFRDPLLDLIGEVHGSVDGGLSTAIKRGLDGGPMDIQGTLGHFYAARTLKERFPGARFRFELPGPGREIDIQMDYLGRRIDIEVKTNLGLEPSINATQIERDLERHIGDRWEDMQYLYSPQVAGDLSDVEQAMVAALQRLAAQGRLPATLPLAQAEALLRARIAAKSPWRLVDVFRY